MSRTVMMGFLKHALMLSLLPGLAGCWLSKAAGEQLQEAGRARDQRISQLEERTQLSHRELDEKVAELEEVLSRATQILQRDSADVGAQIEAIQTQVSSLEGELAELRHNLEAMRQETLGGGGSSSATPELREEEIPADRRQHFQVALEDFHNEKYKHARALFVEYKNRYPDDIRTGEAQYWIAASYLQENKPATALGEYRKVISQHANSTAVNVALYGMGDAFYRLHACTDAKAALEALLKRKPDRELTRRTKQLLQSIRKAPRSYCTS